MFRFSKSAAVAWMCAVSVCGAAEGPPQWAYGTESQPAARGPARSQTPVSLGGSPLQFSPAQISARFRPADWFPDSHPKMPDVVANGREPAVWACALCHYPNGKGRPENAGVAGLPTSYFIEQMKEFREGNRRSADTRKNNTNTMAAIAKAMTDEEIQEAASYFGSMPWTPWIKVVEATTVPKTKLSVGMFLPLPGGEKEPLGERIIEVPVDVEATETLRDPRSSFIAYVPIGSINKGEVLATTGGGKTIACGICHGADLKGMGPVPGLAGRSPSYLVRQMYDMQQGVRKGAWTELMKPVVSKLSEQDMLEIAAYTSSRKP
jgi:cytochrome c553